MAPNNCADEIEMRPSSSGIKSILTDAREEVRSF